MEYNQKRVNELGNRHVHNPESVPFHFKGPTVSYFSINWKYLIIIQSSLFWISVV